MSGVRILEDDQYQEIIPRESQSSTVIFTLTKESMLLADLLSWFMIETRNRLGEAPIKGFANFGALQKQKSLFSSHFDRSVADCGRQKLIPS